MIHFEKLNNSQILLTKDSREDAWGNCSKESLRKKFNIKEEITWVQFQDGKHIGSEILITIK